jgi:hypothetical protein
MSDIEVPYSSPINPTSFSFFGSTSFLIGLVLMALFFIYQMKEVPSKRLLLVELFIGFLSSIFLGFGTLFIMLSFGLYV